MSHSNATQLGFHVSRDAVVTDIEPYSVADVAGLKPLSRLVKISGSDVVAMSHEQMTDVLRSSASVVLTVIPPHTDSHPRRSVHLHCLLNTSTIVNMFCTLLCQTSADDRCMLTPHRSEKAQI